MKIENIKIVNCVYSNKKWVLIEDLTKRLNSVMNVRCDEKMIRKLIIDIQKELGEKQ